MQGREHMKLTPEDWRVIRGASLLTAMPDDVMQRLANDRWHVIHSKGEMLFQKGDPAIACYIVLEGWIKLTRLNDEGHETVVEVFARGDCFAEAAVYVKGKYPVSAETVTNARLIRIDAHMIREEIRQRPEMAFNMLAAMSVRLHRLVDQIEQIKARSAPERVASFMLSICETTSGPASFELPFSKALVAARLGMEPESFSRAVQRLRTLGIDVQKGHVEIEDCAALRGFITRKTAPEEGGGAVLSD